MRKMWLKMQREDGMKDDNALTLGWIKEEVRDMRVSTGNSLLYPDLCSFLHNPSYNFTLHLFLSLSFSLNMFSSNLFTTTSHSFFTFSFFIPLFIRFIFLIQPDGLQGEADLEVDKIIAELTAGILSPATSAPTGKIVGQTTPAQVSSCMPL